MVNQYILYTNLCPWSNQCTLMHLSMSRPTYPRLGRRWGFVTPTCTQGGAFATQISVLFHTDMISWIISRGFTIWTRVGNLREFVNEHLQIPTNPHLCLTWGLTLMGALVKTLDFTDIYCGKHFMSYACSLINHQFPT